ncbi:hypothetical protein OAK92_02735 [Crocinitomicaceae bacterium]|jgi:hypothetical protein|nr:hypothetical protein [Crocinitomicaceae bacterium]
MKKLFFAFVIVGLFVASCGRNGGASNKRAKSLCDCMKDAGIDQLDINSADDNLDEIDDKTQEELRLCVASVLEDMEKDMNKMKNKKAKSKYTRELMKGLIDSECTDKLFESIPYEMAQALFPQAIKALKEDKPVSLNIFGDSAYEHQKYYEEGRDEEYYDGDDYNEEYYIEPSRDAKERAKEIIEDYGDY